MESNKSSKKSKWLRILEEQSWQAELLVSGLVIFGALSIPKYIYLFNDFLLAELPYDIMGWIPYMFIWYLFIASASIIIFFILHFVLRAVWIGIIGVSSVYPNGIDYSTDLYSEDYKNKLRKDFPDINLFTKKLDDKCSLLFAQTFGIAAFLFGFTLLIILCGLLGYILSTVLPFNTIHISYFFAIILACAFFFTSFLNSKTRRDKEWVKKIQYPMTKVIGLLINPFFNESLTYSSLVLTTNAKNQKQSTAQGSFTILAVMFAAIPLLMQSNTVDFLGDRYHEDLGNPSMIYERVYEDQRDPSERILNVTIPSFEQKGNSIQVFMPDIRRENLAYYELTPEWEDDDELSRQENRINESAYYIEGFKRFHKFYLNDEILDNVSTYRYYHPNMGEKGYMTILPTVDCKFGENILKIEKAFYNEKGEPKEMYVRFIYDPKH